MSFYLLLRGDSMNRMTKNRLKKIVELTASIEDDDSVWGMDTEIGNINDILKEAYDIIKPCLRRGY